MTFLLLKNIDRPCDWKSLRKMFNAFITFNSHDFKMQFEQALVSFTIHSCVKCYTYKKLQISSDILREICLWNNNTWNKIQLRDGEWREQRDNHEVYEVERHRKRRRKYRSINTESELMSYINQPIKTKVDLKTWWFAHSVTYPNLFKMFMRFSCIPPTSASSERVFSTGGNIITDKRSMLLPDHVNNFVVVRNNIWLRKSTKNDHFP